MAENIQFFPSNRLNSKPNRSLFPQAEAHEFSGDRMLERADEIIERDHRLTPEQRAVARERFRDIVGALTMNAPFLFLDLSEDAESEVASAGYVAPEAWLTQESSSEDALAFYYYHDDSMGGWGPDVMSYSMWTFLGDIRSGATRLVVGEEAVSNWLRGSSLATVHVQDTATFYLRRDINLLRQIRRANMPIDYLGLTAEQRSLMSEYMIALILDDDYLVKNTSDLLEYLLDVTDAAGRNALYGHIAEGQIEELPVTYSDSSSSRFISVVANSARRMSAIEGQPEGIPLREDARRLLLFAHLYRRRSQMVHEAPQPWPAPRRNRTEGLEELPDDYQLLIFDKEELTTDEIWQDIDYLNYLQSRGASIERLGLTEDRAGKLSFHLHQMLMGGAALGDLRPVFNAIEFAFDASDEAGRHRLYNQMLYAIARDLPTQVAGKGNLGRVVSVLEALLPRVPDSLRNYRGDNLRGPAEVAAVIADMYEYRAGFYIQADITRTGQDEDENPEDPSDE